MNAEYPKDLDDLKLKKYSFQNYGDCRWCGEEIEWWLNPVSGKNVPYNPMNKGTDKAVHHGQTCTERPKK